MKKLCMIAALMGSLAAPVAAEEKPGEGVTVRPVVNFILEEQFWARIVFRALEDLGYTVDAPHEVEIQTAHFAIATGDGDFFASHNGILHRSYFEEAGGDQVLTKLGPLIAGQIQGYLIDKKTYDSGVTDIGMLKDPAIAAKFDTNGDGTADLAGCMPGWGCETIIEHHLTEYGLRDTVTHNQGEYNALMADVISRYESGQPILYYTWTPQWTSGVLVPGTDVEWLSVPYTSLPDGSDANTVYNGKNLGFPGDDIFVLASNKFLADNPAAEELFKKMRIEINDVSAQNKLMADGEDSSEDIDRHVDAWIEAHRSEYDSWLEAARAAAN